MNLPRKYYIRVPKTFSTSKVWWTVRSITSRSQVLCKSCTESFRKIHEKIAVLESFYNKIACLQTQILLGKRILCRRFLWVFWNRKNTRSRTRLTKNWVTYRSDKVLQEWASEICWRQPLQKSNWHDLLKQTISLQIF